MFSVMIRIISFDVAHMLLHMPVYVFGGHDWNTSRRPGQEHQEGEAGREGGGGVGRVRRGVGDTKLMSAWLALLIEVFPLPIQQL